MSFPWTKKVSRVVPAPAPQSTEPVPETQIPQTITLPTVDDKISDIEHKHGEQVADTRQEDDEAHEEQGLVQEGGRPEEGDNGGKEDVEEA